MGVLVTGAGSGLGRYLTERLNAIGLTRENAGELFGLGKTFDTIVHCAFSRSKDVNSGALWEYYNDSIGLTERVLRLSAKHIIFASSISVYPENWSDCQEDEPIPLDFVSSLYGTSKLICESICRANARTTTILRLASLLGLYSPPNVTARLFEGSVTELPLSASSSLNFVTYDEVGEIVDAAIRFRLDGIYNVASAEPISLQDIVAIANAEISYGPIEYRAPSVSIEKAAALAPTLRLPSRRKLIDVMVGANSAMSR